MKNQLYYLVTLAVLAISCAGNQEQTAAPEPPGIGYGVYAEGEQRSITAGNHENIAIWEAYIKAHNEGNLDAIGALNAEGFKAFGPRGEVIDGNEAHMAFLTEWFAAANPKWKSNWFITNAINNDKGELTQWVTSGHDITLTVDDQTINAVQIHDALIEEGKVKMFFVYERVKPAEDE